VLLDNARIHHYKKIKEFIITKPKIEFIYNIPYTPETNPIERVFNDLKRDLRNKKIDNFNLVSEIKNSLININRNNNFQKYFEKSLIYEINKL
jgi:transposase